MTTASRVLPTNWSTAGGDNVHQLENSGSSNAPIAAMQSITMALRFGENTKYAIGYINTFKWAIKRDKQVIHQIEPYPNGTFSGGSTTPGLGSVSFAASRYWPGEPVEVIPGKVDAIEITLDRYALYSSNLLSSLIKSDGAGTEDAVSVADNTKIQYQGDTQNPYVSLIQQTRPVYIYQEFINPISGKIIFGRVFEECWFTDIGETIPDASKNEAVLENGTLTATRVRPYWTI